METELYSTLQKMLECSGLSKRGFCKKHNIPRAWFIDFMNPDIRFRPIQIKTQVKLERNLGIPLEMCREHNKIIKQRKVI